MTPPAVDPQRIIEQVGANTNGSGEPLGADLRAAQLRSRLLTRSQLATLPPPEPLIGGVLLRDTIAALFGKPGAAKSFLALDWALSVATGSWWFGREVHQGPVLYIAAEGVAGIPRRVEAWESARRTPVSDSWGVRWLPNAVNLLSPEWVDGLLCVVTELAPVLIVVDTLARSMPGGDENGAKDMGALVESADRLRRACGACVVLVHHEPRTGGALRGHSSLDGAVDTAIEVTKDHALITMHNTKQKDIPEFVDITVSLRPSLQSAVISPTEPWDYSESLVESEAELLDCVGQASGTEGLTGTDLRDIANMTKSTLYRTLKALRDKGLVVNVGTDTRPRWAVALGPKL